MPAKTNANVLADVAALPPPGKLQDILQFSTAEYFCLEGETEVVLQVDRLGKGDTAARVEYFTKDGSAKAGKKYKASQGVLEFSPGDFDKTIRIPLIDKDAFDSVLEFEVHLEKVKGAMLGTYGHTCEVTIADDDFFPTNASRKGDGIVDPWRLMSEFMRMCMQDMAFRWRFIVDTILDMLDNLKTPYQILLTTFLIDRVLKPSDGSEAPDNVSATVLLVVCGMLIPDPVLWLCHNIKAGHRLPGKANMRLSQNLMRKFLNYSQTSRDLVSSSDLTMAMTRDVPELIEKGLMTACDVLREAGLLIMLGGLALARTPEQPWLTVIMFFVFPILLVGFLRTRQRGTVIRRNAHFQCQTCIVGFVGKVTTFYRLIADYFQKQETVTKFCDEVQALNNANTRLKKYNILNEAFAPLLTDVFVGIYIFLSYRRVLDGGPIGEFITGIQIWREIGQCYVDLYESLLELQQATAPLANVVFYMNLPVDVPDRVHRNRMLLEQLDKAQAASQKLLYQGERSDCSLVQNSVDIRSGDIVERACYAQDLVQIDCQALTFAYQEDVKLIFQDANFEISQGQLAAIMGGRGEGKSTLLQLIAGVLVPPEGRGLLFVPPHLRVLQVTFNPLILPDQDMLGNLVYGPSDAVDENTDRVLKICTDLGMSSRVIEHIRCLAKGETERVAPKVVQAPDKPKNISLMHSASRFGMIAVESVSKTPPQAHCGGTAHSQARRQESEKQYDDSHVMSYTDRCLINIARGFVMNPEVMILHKPLSAFDTMQQAKVLELLRNFVDLRGVECPLATRHLRRPRTLIFSVAATEGLDRADVVLKVSKGQVHVVNMNAMTEFRNRLRTVFKQLDCNADGHLSREEFCTRGMQIAGAGKAFGIDDDIIARGGEELLKKLGEIFSAVDVSGNDDVSLDELTTYVSSQMEVPTVKKTGGTTAKAAQVTPSPKGRFSNGTWEDSDVPQEAQFPRPRSSSACDANFTNRGES